MKNDELFDGITGIREDIIIKAENYKFKKKKKIYKKKWMMAVAAVLVLAIGISILFNPMQMTAYAVALPEEARIVERPDRDDYKNSKEWEDDYEAWNAARNSREETSKQAASELLPFFTESTGQFLLTEKNENKLWSPVNAYIGLAMTTELTEGETRKQILDLFGATDTNELRKQVSAVWESVYKDDSHEICVLANSLWLEEGIQYNRDVMDALAYHYYASVYQGDLGSEKINKDIASWINQNTGNFLKKNSDKISLPPETVLALYSTLYFQAKWSHQFAESKNTEDVFHMQDGDTRAVYMNKKLADMNYYWGEDFSAVNMPLKNGCRMWFILPDEGKTTNDVLQDGTYMDMVLSDDWEDCKYMMVNLSVPKFDVSSTLDLKEGLMNLGATNIFREDAAEFDKLTAECPIFLTGAKQSVRVQIDEEGVKAATYMEMIGAGSAAPPEEEIDFVLDRPFLFVITNGNLPLFAGCVNNPEN